MCLLLVCQENPNLSLEFALESFQFEVNWHYIAVGGAPPNEPRDKRGVAWHPGGVSLMGGGWENSITINVGRIEGFKGESKAMTLFLGHGAATRWLTEFSSITTIHCPPPTALPHNHLLAVWDLGIGIGQNWPGWWGWRYYSAFLVVARRQTQTRALFPFNSNSPDIPLCFPPPPPRTPPTGNPKWPPRLDLCPAREIVWGWRVEDGGCV